jgi:hypothetical protein
MKKWFWFTLLAILVFAIVLRIMPLTNYAVWGSDTGEYYFLSDHLEREGRMVEDYDGWGFGYPYFPGMFYLSVEVAMLTGLDLLYTMMILIPTIAAFGVVVIYLLTRRLGGSESAGLVAAAATAVAMPVVITTSHAMPGAIGDFLALLCLLLLLKSYHSQRFLILLVAASIALVITHHLSTFIVLIAVVTIAIFREALKVPQNTIERLKIDITYIFLLLNLILFYWLIYAEPFRERVISSGLGDITLLGAAVIIYAAFAGIVGILFLIRKKVTYTYKPKEHSTLRRWTYFGALLLLSLSAIAISSFVHVPPLEVSPGPILVMYLLPFVILVAFGSLGPNEALRSKEGIFLLAWIAGIGFAIIASILTGSQEIILYRYAQYMLEAWAIGIGIGAVVLFKMVFTGGRTEGAVKGSHRPAGVMAFALILTLIVISAGVTANPPKEALGGFQEGITTEEMHGVYWCRTNLESDATVATDHRLSSMLFGFAGLNASWDFVVDTFHEESFEDIRSELEDIGLPSGRKRIDYVMLSDELRDGVALVQWKQAEPMSDAAIAKFDKNPFYKIYDSGEVQVYQIDWNQI